MTKCGIYAPRARPALIAGGRDNVIHEPARAGVNHVAAAGRLLGRAAGNLFRAATASAFKPRLLVIA